MRFHPAHPDYHKGIWGRVVFDPTLMTALTVVSTVVSAAGTLMSGNAARGAANFEAAQMKQQAGQERAVAQRQAIEQRRQAGLANSRVQAVAAASGAGATDPTVLNIEGNNAATGEYNALSALYSGEEKARGFEMSAAARKYEGATARQSALLGAGGTLMGGAAKAYGSSPKSLNQKYAGEMPALPSQLPWQNVPGYTVPNYG